MILEKQTEGLILQEGEVQESTSMEIDAESHVFLMRMLSKFYSDGIGSAIRETASNALDSHRAAGVKEPIIVSLKRKDGNYEFSVEDFGLGIDSDIVKNVLKKYGKSTKRQDENALGAFGLGFKSPLAYSPSFYFIGRKDGVERKWMMYEAEDEENKIDLVYQNNTTERNGVKVIIPVKYQDVSSFLSKIKQQLAYFEDVYFDCDTGYVTSISNDFQITRYQNYQYSPLSPDPYLHLCLDNVYYPIDFAKLGIDTIHVPVALRFGLSDGIYPLPNRETLKYTEEAKKAILDKIKVVATDLISRYNENMIEGDDVSNLFNYYNTNYRNLDGFEIHSLEEYSIVPFKEPTLKNIKKLNLRKMSIMKDTILKGYNKLYSYRNKRFSKTNSSVYDKQLQWWDIEGSEKRVYITEEVITKTKKDYFRDTLEHKSAIFVKFEKEFPLFSKTPNSVSFKSLLSLEKHPRSEWREVIKEFQYLRSLIVKNFIDMDKITIPKTWFDEKKKQKDALKAKNVVKAKTKKLEGEVTGKVATYLERYVANKNCKFVPCNIQMAKAHQEKYFTVYADNSEESENKIQKLFSTFNNLPRSKNGAKIRFVIFSQNAFKNLKNIDLHNWMTMEEFEKQEHIIFKRVATACLINSLMVNYSSVFNKYNILKDVSSDLSEKLRILKEYKEAYYIRGDATLYDGILEVAEAKNLFDPKIHPTFLEITKTLKKLPFLNKMLSLVNYYHDDTEISGILIDLFKYYRMKVDWVHYKVPMNEESVKAVKEEELKEII